MPRALVAALLALLVLPAAALAHIERTAYWPNPAPDRSVKPAAGGKVPTPRTLASALGADRARTRVVCQRGSMRRLRAALRRAQTRGVTLRPTQRPRKLTARQAAALLRTNRRLLARCRYHDIQPAVTATRNNGRVVIMPGVYTEPRSRRVPAQPKACEKYRTTSEKGKGAASYPFQFHCPNAQALVALIGRALGPGQDPPSSLTGRPDPHGIPNEGRCIRCNVQIEGSGPSPDDVVIDAGRVKSGNRGPLGSKKDVALRADRADGVVLRNFTARHAAEHDVYLLEVDGYLQDRLKLYYAGEYGTLMFTSDHGITQRCDAVGNGDSGVYPGGAPDTGTMRDKRFYPAFRLNQTIRWCDMHHNNMATSGTMGNAVQYYENDMYGNGAGIVTDSFYAGGHPGFPQDSTVYEGNRIYSNNFNVYGPKSDVKSTVAIPVGVGALIAGGNYNVVRNNFIYDNWRRGAMLIAVPDAISCAPSPENGAPPCTPKGAATTSTGNRYYNNVMGRSPSGRRMPNGVDFWWDEFPTNRGNCWTGNIGPDGTARSITSDPPRQPVSGLTVPGFLPSDCGAPTNVGQGDAAKEAMLVDCAENGNDGVCEWYKPPARPGTAAAARQRAEARRAVRGRENRMGPLPHCELFGGPGGYLTCRAFSRRLG